MKDIRQKKNSGGFTIIEVLISTAIFVLIVVVGMTALVNINRNYKLTAQVRQSIDTMSFVMEDMSRNLRLGTQIECVGVPPNQCEINPDGTQGDSYIKFIAQDGVTLISYKIDEDPDVAGVYRLYKSMDVDGLIFTDITPQNVRIDLAQSGFSVTKVTPDAIPLVTIRMAGQVNYQTSSMPFNFQTSITPRNI